MTTDPQFLTSAFWYSKFKLALSAKEFPLAEEYFKRYQYWKRRADLNVTLSEICLEKQFGARQR